MKPIVEYSDNQGCDICIRNNFPGKWIPTDNEGRCLSCGYQLLHQTSMLPNQIITLPQVCGGTKMIDNAEEILLRLMEKEEFRQEIELIKSNLLTPEIKNLTIIAHDLFCDIEHGRDCMWYEEAQLEECWISTDHALWVNRIRAYIEDNSDLTYQEKIRRLHKIRESKELIATLSVLELAMLGHSV